MKKCLQDFSALAVIGSMLLVPLNNASANGDFPDDGIPYVEAASPNEYEFAGIAYENSRAVPAISPIIAVGAVIIITAIAIAVYDRDSSRIRSSRISSHAHA